ncbi:MAG: succinate dehydrogenase cytochrome b subunit, partial [Bacteroidota bacterium]
AKKKTGILAFYESQTGKKLLTGVTGLGLALFTVVHMLGNLNYFISYDAYNVYAYKLASLGPLLWAAELGLLAFVLLHAVIGVTIYIRKRRARPKGYVKYKSAGGVSKQNAASRSMIITGIVLAVFLVFHLKAFKFGAYYETVVDGQVMRDLTILLEQKFASVWYVLGYVSVVVLLGLHLRHGVWSAFQSLGAIKPSLRPLLILIGIVVAIGVVVGFIALPIWIFVDAHFV